MRAPLPPACRRRPDRRAWCVAGLLSVCAATQAQDGGGRGGSLSASVEASASYNVNSRRGGIDGGDFVTQLSPGLRWDSRSGRVVGSLSYALSLSHHSRGYDGQNIHNRLSATLSAEAVPSVLYVDASANISQQNVSAFGTQSAPGSSQYNPNRIEVGTLSVSPHLRGVFGSAVNYEARLSASATNGRRSIAADSTAVGGTLSLSSAVGGAPIGWGLVGSRTKVDFRAGRETVNDRLSANLQFIPDADLIFTLRGGQEATDVANVQRTSYNNWGVGVTWRPDPRTRVQADTDDRYFGRSYRVLLDHRMASSSVQFSSSRDITNARDPNGSGQRVSLYDIFFAQFASLVPDEIQRDLVVRAFLLAQGLDPNATVAGGFINTAVTLQQSHQLTLSYAGLRMAASVNAFANNSKVIDATGSTTAREPTRQWGYMANASYRLSPTQSLVLAGSRLITQPTPTNPGSALKSLSLSYSDQIARRTTMSLGARYSVFNSSIDSYREAAISASLSQRF